MSIMMTNTNYDEQLLEQWQSEPIDSQSNEEEFRSYTQYYDDVFSTQSQRTYFATYMKGLLSTLDRKSIEPIALHFLGEKSVRPMQLFFTRSPLKEEKILEAYQARLANALNCEGGMLSVDDTGFIKKGTHSAGVKRQYCGRTGKRENCQIGVFMAYAGDEGYGLVDRELYIPKEWFEESYKKLREEAGIPPEKVFRTKNQIAQEMLNQALTSGRFKVKWVGGDAAFGSSYEFLDGLKLPEGVWYFANVSSRQHVFREYPEMIFPPKKQGHRKHAQPSVDPVTIASIAEDPKIPWETITLGEGTKGPIQAERKCIRCVTCRKDGCWYYLKPGDAIWLYLRKYENEDIKCFVTNAPADISIKELDRAATLRWPIEQCFEECKSNLGMTHYEGRTYTAWTRHILFVMITHLFTTEIRKKVKKKESP